MGLLRTVLVTALAVLCAPAVLARGMSVRVCNEGQLTVDAVAAYEEWGALSSYWVVEGWFNVHPGQCKVVYESSYVCDDTTRFWTPCARVRVAYWFKDAAGVAGVPTLRYPDFPPGSEKICVSLQGVGGEHRRSPDAGCGRNGWFLVPVVAKIDTYEGNGPFRPMNDFQGTTLTVALGRRDHPQPVAGAEAADAGRPPPATAAPPVPVKYPEMEALVTDAMVGLGAPRAHIKASGAHAIDRLAVQVCVDSWMVLKTMVTNPPPSWTAAVKTALRQFMQTHWFRDAGSSPSDTRGSVQRLIRITGSGEAFTVEEVADCAGNPGFATSVALAGAPATAQAPVPQTKAPDTSSGGFGDLLGPGGFVKPPSR